MAKETRPVKTRAARPAPSILVKKAEAKPQVLPPSEPVAVAGGDPVPVGDPGNLLAIRRAQVAASGVKLDSATVPHGSIGLALSGGGIRSATLSLGLVQAFARHGRLFDFDYLSTVSGGGYFGSFLKSLFVPDAVRGSAGTACAVTPGQATETKNFVEYVLSLDARAETVDDPTPVPPNTAKAQIRNPIWWLREHGRYLAPNGPTDYGFAVSYVARNWAAMIYTFFVAAAAASFLALGVEWALLHCGLPGSWLQGIWPEAKRLDFLTALHWSGGADPDPALTLHATPGQAVTASTAPGEKWALILSPLVALPPILLAASVATGFAYWLTVSLRTGRRWLPATSHVEPESVVVDFLLQAYLVLIATALCAFWLMLADKDHVLSISEMLKFWSLPWPRQPVGLGVALSLLGILIGLLVAGWTALSISGDAFTNEVRRRLTALGAAFNWGLIVVTVAALVDTAAIWIAPHVRNLTGGGQSGLSVAAIIPILAWVIGNVPKWLGGGTVAKFVGEHVWTAALIVGATSFLLVALSADTAVHLVSWNFVAPAKDIPAPGPWALDMAADLGLVGSSFVPLALIVLGLFFLTGTYTGFINLSSLHSIYSGRLTRAFLGASNLERLREAALPGGRPITENHPKDYIDVALYQQCQNAGPLHLINVTLNETKNTTGSQLVDRDRKGVPVVFAPEGVYVDAGRSSNGQNTLFPWRIVENAKVESLSVGQLCAISGAAASSGMGARTTLGGALALTFANIRLGYWWDARHLLPQMRAAQSFWWTAWVGATRPARTYYYFWCEMLARYTRQNRRVYLSDGGHFENSGAYELLRRRVPLILVNDGGADPDYAFEDLENLTRKARIDLGLSVVVSSGDAVRSEFGLDSGAIFLNGGKGGWRKAAQSKDGAGFALLLDVYETEPDSQNTRRVGRIIWLKPRLFPGLPPDVEGYGARNLPFPQQPTGDQFFDEAQWESYRALGYAMGALLLTCTKSGADVLRKALQ